MGMLKKVEFARELKSKLEIPSIEMAIQVYDSFCEIIKKNLMEGLDVRLEGVGLIKVKDVPERMQRNPFTGEQFKAPAHRKLAFRIDGTTRNELKGGKKPAAKAALKVASKPEKKPVSKKK